MAGQDSHREANIREADAAAVADAARILRAGGLVAFPTETVYGLGADATDDDAVARIFTAKNRPRTNPLIVHCLTLEEVAAQVVVTRDAEALAARFWPGPLTLVLHRRAEATLSPLVGGGGETIAMRLPRGRVAQDLIAATARPIAAPSANRAGTVSPTTADHVARALGDRIDLILDGGACPVGIESTVLDLTGAHPTVLRPGGVTAEDIAQVLGRRPSAAADPGSGKPVAAPGLLGRHYAPGRPLRLDARRVHAGEALLAFGPHPPRGAAHSLNLSPTGDLTEAAANLFAMLRALDDPRFDAIAVMPVPNTGFGRAINDRLRRAAGLSAGRGRGK